MSDRKEHAHLPFYIGRNNTHLAYLYSGVNNAPGRELHGKALRQSLLYGVATGIVFGSLIDILNDGPVLEAITSPVPALSQTLHADIHTFITSSWNPLTIIELIAPLALGTFTAFGMGRNWDLANKLQR